MTESERREPSSAEADWGVFVPLPDDDGGAFGDRAATIEAPRSRRARRPALPPPHVLVGIAAAVVVVAVVLVLVLAGAAR